MKTKSVFIFHRSLRLQDNLGLINALKSSNLVIPIFIFTPEQITTKNLYRSLNIMKFMMDSLIDLDNELRSIGSKLFIFYGKPDDILKHILESDPDIQSVHINADYTPYAIEREKQLKTITENANRDFTSIEDCLLHSINTIRSKSDSYYSVFTPFYKEALKHIVQKPVLNNHKNYVKKTYTILNETTFDNMKKVCGYDKVELYDFVASRIEGENRLKKLKNHKLYDKTRDTLALETTRLSPYLKFGLISPREVYHQIKKLFDITHPLIRQLYWREFYYNLSFNRQDILKESKSFRESYDKIKWKKSIQSKKLLELWKTGQTGYPLIDAGMRELNMTGYMHNRARLVTSNFLVKHLFIDWREGELYFASKLLDYDPSVNNGNWQFTSGSGADSQPYFRMMNPWLQQARHDPNCSYIKSWIPELENVPIEDLHNWQNMYQDHLKHGIEYVKPCKMYDHAELKKESKSIYSNAFER
jgi:deoxyribodipyrimidine photo-lyase